ncbi:MAG: STAS domain-containing protein [Gammaproteobacteria bacterium]|jgi:phospholipid transport system transporter-binding protein|nr:STAS domain-containing protein [Gammaproteobacteria bacterium]
MQLSQAEITQQSQQKYLISGTVDFSTVPDLMRQSSVFFAAVKASDDSSPNSRQVTVDLSKVEECNSAALALMLEIVKNAQQKKLEVHFENLPATLLTIARAYGVENEIRDLCK